MKKFLRLRHSFLHHFVIKFIAMAVIPLLCSWWIYEKILTFYYAENAVAMQQVNMEKSLSLLDASLGAAENIFIAVSGNQEIQYYLDYGFQDRNMYYGNFLDIHAFCEKLYLMTPYLSDLKIYSDNPDIIYAGPFGRLEEFAPGEETLQALENSILDEIIWEVALSEREGEFPAIHGFQKLYTKYYEKHIGYMEILLSPSLFADYFDTISSLSTSPDIVLELYLGTDRIYATEDIAIDAEIFSSDMASGYEVQFFQNKYYNYLKIPRFDMYILRSGSLMNADGLPSGNIPSVFISVILALLLALFVGFFGNILSLSRRILTFSSFIRNSNPDRLLPFCPWERKARQEDELDTLIAAYNELIQDKNSLISQIRKLELFSQDARFQALQGQIHPHFIYGTLETVRMMTLQNQNEEAATMICALSALIRSSMAISEKPVSLWEELVIAGHYMEIQKIRFDERISYVVEVEEGLMDFQLPSFVLQPLLENAIVYGVSQTEESCTLTVEAKKEDGCVRIKVSNTGPSISRERLGEVNALLSGQMPPEDFKGNNNGLALYNIGERLAIFFDGRASLRLEQEEGRTVNVIIIGLES